MIVQLDPDTPAPVAYLAGADVLLVHRCAGRAPDGSDCLVCPDVSPITAPVYAVHALDAAGVDYDASVIARVAEVLQDAEWAATVRGFEVGEVAAEPVRELAHAGGPGLWPIRSPGWSHPAEARTDVFPAAVEITAPIPAVATADPPTTIADLLAPPPPSASAPRRTRRRRRMHLTLWPTIAAASVLAFVAVSPGDGPTGPAGVPPAGVLVPPVGGGDAPAADGQPAPGQGTGTAGGEPGAQVVTDGPSSSATPTPAPSARPQVRPSGPVESPAPGGSAPADPGDQGGSSGAQPPKSEQPPSSSAEPPPPADDPPADDPPADDPPVTDPSPSPVDVGATGG